MPVNKNAFLRYIIYLRELRNATDQKPVSKKRLLKAVEFQLLEPISSSTLEKDIQFLRDGDSLGMVIPIKTTRPNGFGSDCRIAGYYLEPGFKFSEQLAAIWNI